MQLLIKELAPELQELVHQRQRECGNNGIFDGKLDESGVNGNFSWVSTPEGSDFWYNVFKGRDMSDDRHYPKVPNTTNAFKFF